MWSAGGNLGMIWAGVWTWVCANETSVDPPSLRKTSVSRDISRNCTWNIGTILNDGCSRFCGISCIFSKAQKNCFQQKGVLSCSVVWTGSTAFVYFSAILYLKNQWQIWIKMVSEDWTGKTVDFLCCNEQNFSLKEIRGRSHGRSTL